MWCGNAETARYCSGCGTILGANRVKSETATSEAPVTRITAYKDKKKLLVPRRDAILPIVCVKCGSTRALHTYKLSWMNPGYFALFLLGILPYLIARIFLSRSVRLNVPLCDVHYNRSHRLMIAGRACIVAALPVGYLLASNVDPQVIGIFTVVFAFPMVVIGFVILWAHYPMTATRIEPDHAELAGASSEFLQLIPQRPA